MSEERIKISLNEEEVQNIINAYEKDIEYIKHLESVLKEIREYIKEKQKIQYKFALSRIECDDILEIIDKGIGEDK